MSIEADVNSLRSGRVDVAQPDDANPVTATVEISSARIRPGDEVSVKIRAQIAPGWHIYGLEGGSSPNQPTQLKLTLPKGISAIGEWKAPVPAAQVSPTGLASVYSGEAVFSRLLRVSEEFKPAFDAVNCEFRYQACDHARCLRPQSIQLTVPIQVVADKE